MRNTFLTLGLTILTCACAQPEQAADRVGRDQGRPEIKDVPPDNLRTVNALRIYYPQLEVVSRAALLRNRFAYEGKLIALCLYSNGGMVARNRARFGGRIDVIDFPSEKVSDSEDGDPYLVLGKVIGGEHWPELAHVYSVPFDTPAQCEEAVKG